MLETLSYTSVEKFNGTTNAAAVSGNDAVQPERDHYFDAGIGRSFDLPRIGHIDTRIALINAFDHIYEIRSGTGIGVNQANFAPRRALCLDCVAPFSRPGAPKTN